MLVLKLNTRENLIKKYAVRQVFIRFSSVIDSFFRRKCDEIQITDSEYRRRVEEQLVIVLTACCLYGETDHFSAPGQQKKTPEISTQDQFLPIVSIKKEPPMAPPTTDDKVICSTVAIVRFRLHCLRRQKKPGEQYVLDKCGRKFQTAALPGRH